MARAAIKPLMTYESDIKCSELGSDEAERSSDPFACGDDDLRALERHAAQRRLVLHACPDNRFRVEGAAHCGRLRLPSGRTVVIRTKVPAGRLLEWLAFTDAIPPLEAWSPSPAVAVGEDLAEVLVRLYLEEVELVTRFHRRPGYLLKRLVSSEVRGAIDERRLASVCGRLPAMPIRSRERSLDTLANRVIAAGLRAAARLIPGPSNLALNNHRSMLAKLSREWSDVTNPASAGAIDSALALAAPPVGYRTALQLARLLLVGVGIDMIGGDGGDSFLVNLSTLWEEAVRRMAAAWAARRVGWVYDAARTRQWDDERHINDPARWLTVDALLRGPGVCSIVLDAKYKREFAVEARVDRFQMAAYCLAFGATISCLVYPRLDDTTTASRLLLRSQLAQTRGQIHSMALPMARGPLKCTEALKRELDNLLECHQREGGSKSPNHY